MCFDKIEITQLKCGVLIYLRLPFLFHMYLRESEERIYFELRNMLAIFEFIILVSPGTTLY